MAPGARVGGLLSLTFLELAKPRENASESVRRWMDYFAGRPLDGGAPAYFESALRLASEQDLSAEEKAMIDAYEKAEIDRANQIESARWLGEQQGIEQGVLQGIEQSRLQIARTALAEGLSADVVSRITGLPLSAVEELQKQGFPAESR